MAITPSGKLILVAGMYRSGSTWLYNAARMYLQEMHGEDSVYGCYITDYDPQNEKPFHVVKGHEYIPEIVEAADLIVLSERNFEDIAISMSKFHDLPYSAADIEKLCEYYSSYENYRKKSIVFRYQEIMETVDDCLIGKSSSLIRLTWGMMQMGVIKHTSFSDILEDGIMELVMKIEALPIPDGTPDYADPITLLHPKHK